ncbi:MAG: hypothetical protein MHM6MM_003620 [Cercozoa sp. M6MM]
MSSNRAVTQKSKPAGRTKRKALLLDVPIGWVLGRTRDVVQELEDLVQGAPLRELRIRMLDDEAYAQLLVVTQTRDQFETLRETTSLFGQSISPPVEVDARLPVVGGFTPLEPSEYYDRVHYKLRQFKHVPSCTCLHFTQDERRNCVHFEPLYAAVCGLCEESPREFLAVYQFGSEGKMSTLDIVVAVRSNTDLDFLLTEPADFSCAGFVRAVSFGQKPHKPQRRSDRKESADQFDAIVEQPAQFQDGLTFEPAINTTFEPAMDRALETKPADEKPRLEKSTPSKDKTVSVRSYRRQDGTQVRAHMRSPPTRSPSKTAKDNKAKGDEKTKKTVKVKGYTRQDGTKVAAHTRAAPKPRNSSSTDTKDTAATGSTVKVSGYTRKDGTKVAAHTRAAPGSATKTATKTEPKSATSATRVSVAGYTRSDGTHVRSHTRAAPGTAGSATAVTDTPSSSSSSRVVHVPSYTRSDGTRVAAHTRSAPRRSTTSSASVFSGLSSSSSSSASSGRTYVSGYTRSNGTKVAGYYRGK